jgi:tetratricopeptide (TPR) repeat protein
MTITKYLLLSAWLGVTVHAQSGTDTTALLQQASALLNEDRLEDAAVNFRAAISIEERNGGDAVRLATALNGLGVVYRKQNKPEPAARTLERARSVLHESNAKEAALIPVVLHNLGRVCVEQNNWDKAEKLFREAIRRWSPDSPGLSAGLESLADLLIARGKLKDAADLQRRALELDQARFPAGHLRIALDLNNAGALEAARRRYPQAEELLRRAVEMMEARHTEDSALADALGNLAEVLRRQKKLPEAEQVYARATAILSNLWGANDPRLLSWRQQQARVLRAREDFAGAERLEMESMRVHVSSIR